MISFPEQLATSNRNSQSSQGINPPPTPKCHNLIMKKPIDTYQDPIHLKNDRQDSQPATPFDNTNFIPATSSLTSSSPHPFLSSKLIEQRLQIRFHSTRWQIRNDIRSQLGDPDFFGSGNIPELVSGPVDVQCIGVYADGFCFAGVAAGLQNSCWGGRETERVLVIAAEESGWFVSKLKRKEAGKGEMEIGRGFVVRENGTCVFW